MPRTDAESPAAVTGWRGKRTPAAVIRDPDHHTFTAAYSPVLRDKLRPIVLIHGNKNTQRLSIKAAKLLAAEILAAAEKAEAGLYPTPATPAPNTEV